MALIIEDRVQENTGITGNSDYILLGAVTGFRTFGSVMANADTTYYAVTNDTDWEVGIGTYSTTGPTLARTTILASSNGGLAVSWSAGVKKIFLTYAASKSAYLDASGYLLVADRIAHTGDTDTAILFPAANTVSVDTGGAERLRVENSTITTTVPIALPANPTLALQATTKQYVDALIASGIHFHQPVRVENPANLNATYNNGTAGVGATLTNAGTQVALVVDGVTVATNDRVLVYQQTNQTQNGIYVVTNTGSGSTNWVLTRASDANTYVINSANGLSEGSTVFVQQGTTGAGETYTCNTSGVITFGTTNITFAQISTAQIYSAGAGLALTGTVFSNTAPDQVVTLTQGGATTITGTYPNFTISTLAGLTSSVAELNVLTGMTASTAELNQLNTNTFTSAVAVPAGTVSNPAIYPTGDNNTGIFFPAADTIAFSEGGAEVMRITPDARVGILTTTPSTALHVNGTVTATSFAGSASLTGTPTAPTAAVGTDTTQLATTAFVNAEIANDAPTKTGGGASGTWGISITGNAATATSATSATTATTATTANALNTANDYRVDSLGVGTAASGVSGEIRATNNVTAYFSDDRLKTRFGNIDDALGKLMSLSGFYYEPNGVAQALGYEVKKEVGVSAQEVQAAMPEVVAPAPIDAEYLTVRYERLVPVLIQAIKELTARVAQLEGK